MSLEIIRTDGQNKDFIKLIGLLDEELRERYRDIQSLYDRHNKVDRINHVVLIYKDKAPVACGAFKEYDGSSVELKRIFVVRANRDQGLGKLVVRELEKYAKDSGYKYAILETGVKQPEAIGLYKGRGYAMIQNYGPYAGNTNSVCMKKEL